MGDGGGLCCPVRGHLLANVLEFDVRLDGKTESDTKRKTQNAKDKRQKTKYSDRHRGGAAGAPRSRPHQPNLGSAREGFPVGAHMYNMIRPPNLR